MNMLPLLSFSQDTEDTIVRRLPSDNNLSGNYSIGQFICFVIFDVCLFASRTFRTKDNTYESLNNSLIRKYCTESTVQHTSRPCVVL
jgi:hypothetical protein